MLTNVQIQKAKPKDKPYKLTDSAGLYILVHPNGSKYWRMKYRFDGKEQLLSIGVYPDVSLLQARQARDAAKKQLKDGINPAMAKRRKNVSDCFQAVAAEWYEKMTPQWSPKHTSTIQSRLTRYIYPHIGTMDINAIKAPDILRVLDALQNAQLLETAKRVRIIIGQVFSYAVQTGRTENNPAYNMRGVIAAPKIKHMPAITTPKELGMYLKLANDYAGSFPVKCALQFLPLVFVRPGELRHAEWKEFDFKTAEWRIPAHKMKMKEEHVVPLSRQALAILEKLKPITGSSPYLFPSGRTLERPMSENAVNAALRRLGYEKGEVTGHGFRATASTLLNELGFLPDIIERQLAHAERNKVKGAYNRAGYMKERRQMMQQWADYLDELRSVDK